MAIAGRITPSESTVNLRFWPCSPSTELHSQMPTPLSTSPRLSRQKSGSADDCTTPRAESTRQRWVRDEGYMKIVPRAVGALLKQTGTDAATVSAFILPCTLSRVVPGVAKRIGIPDAAVRDNLAAVCGDTGAAHPLVMLVHALEGAKPGDLIVVAAFDSGCDALLFRVTDAIATLDRLLALERWLVGDARYWRAVNENQMEQLDVAWDDVGLAARLMRNAAVPKLAGIIAYKRHQLDVAREKFEESWKLGHDDCETGFYLGIVLGEQSTWAKTAQVLIDTTACLEKAEGKLKAEIIESAEKVVAV